MKSTPKRGVVVGQCPQRDAVPAYVGAGVDELVVAAADTADAPRGIKSRKVARVAACAAVDGAHGEFAAGHANAVRGAGIGTGHSGLFGTGSPTESAIAAEMGLRHEPYAARREEMAHE